MTHCLFLLTNLFLRWSFSEQTADMLVANGVTDMPTLATSSAATTLATMATCGQRSSPPTCSTPSSSRTLWTKLKDAGIARQSSRRVEARTRWSSSPSFSAGLPTRRRSTPNWDYLRRKKGHKVMQGRSRRWTTYGTCPHLVSLQ